MAKPSFNDLATGLLLLVVAGFGFWLCMDLRLGTAQRMGPGYLPRLMCIVLGLLGLANILRGFLIAGPAREPWTLKPLLLVSLSIAIFMFGIERIGLVASVAGLVVVASLAATDMRPLEVAISAAVLAAFSALLFVKLLGLTMPIWPDLVRLGL